MDDLHKILKSFPQDEIESYLTTTFKVIVETFCKHFTQKEKVQKIEVIYLFFITLNRQSINEQILFFLSAKGFSYLPIKGSVNLRNPDTILFYIEYYGIDPNCIPDEPEELFFGRWVKI